MPQHQDLKLLRPLRTAKQNQQLEQTPNDPVSEGQTLKQQTSTTHRPTLPARTTPSNSPLSVPRTRFLLLERLSLRELPREVMRGIDRAEAGAPDRASGTRWSRAHSRCKR